MTSQNRCVPHGQVLLDRTSGEMNSRKSSNSLHCQHFAHGLSGTVSCFSASSRVTHAQRVTRSRSPTKHLLQQTMQFCRLQEPKLLHSPRAVLALDGNGAWRALVRTLAGRFRLDGCGLRISSRGWRSGSQPSCRQSPEHSKNEKGARAMGVLVVYNLQCSASSVVQAEPRTWRSVPTAEIGISVCVRQ